jgi:hypothetical protein
MDGVDAGVRHLERASRRRFARRVPRPTSPIGASGRTTPGTTRQASRLMSPSGGLRGKEDAPDEPRREARTPGIRSRLSSTRRSSMASPRGQTVRWPRIEPALHHACPLHDRSSGFKESGNTRSGDSLRQACPPSDGASRVLGIARSRSRSQRHQIAAIAASRNEPNGDTVLQARIGRKATPGRGRSPLRRACRSVRTREVHPAGRRAIQA